jgi:hypothetical protein
MQGAMAAPLKGPYVTAAVRCEANDIIENRRHKGIRIVFRPYNIIEILFSGRNVHVVVDGKLVGRTNNEFATV